MAPKIAKIDNFSKGSIFIEYSTAVEYSDGLKKIFWTTNLYKFSPKKFHVNRTISFENSDRVNPPQKSQETEGGEFQLKLQ